MAIGNQNHTTYISNKVISRYKSGTWLNSLSNSAITLSDEDGSYGGWICGPTKDGRIAISTNQNDNNYIYLGYGERGRVENSFAQSIYWDGANNILSLKRVDMNWLRVVNNDSNNSDDAVVYIENKNGNDWALKINTGANNYGLYISSTGTYLLKVGDNNNFYVNSDYVGTNSLFRITANSNTTTIGSQNSSFCHIYNSANISFIFNNTVLTTTGNLGNTSYPWNNLYIGKANGAGIYYVGSKNTYRMIRFIDNTSDTYGNGISIGGGGQTIIGGGESADTAAAQVGTAGSEVMYICNDGNVDIMSNLQNGWDNRKVMTLNTSGYLMLPSYINVPTGNNENPSVSQFIVTNGSDHYYRKASVAHAASALDGQHKWVRLAGDTMSGALYTTDLRAANTRLVSNWLGFYASTNAGGNRYGYILADANRMYFRKENGVSTYHFDFNGHVYTSQAFYTASGIYLTSNTNARLTLDRCTVYAANGVVGIHSSTNRGVYEFTDSKWIIFLQHSDDTVRSSYKIYGAVWNDYAEYRNAVNAKPGQCIIESPTHKMELSTKRLQPGGRIVSDTFGFAIGQTEIANIPIAVSGRVLAYPYKPMSNDDLGKAVCTAPNGTVDIMTREEIKEYPERIIGTVSEIPNYDIWYGGSNATAETKADNIPILVDGRIWIYVR